jgi:hypothetical protein
VSEGHIQPDDHAHERAAPEAAPFRFEAFADAASAQAAFEAAYPSGSPIAPALQALVDMGAHCKAVSATRVACRYVEKQGILAGWCWHVALDANSDKVIQRVGVSLAMLGP